MTLNPRCTCVYRYIKLRLHSGYSLVSSLMWNVVSPDRFKSLLVQLVGFKFLFSSFKSGLQKNHKLKKKKKKSNSRVEGCSVASGGSQCRPPVHQNKCLNNIQADTAGSTASGSKTARTHTTHARIYFVFKLNDSFTSSTLHVLYFKAFS